MNKTNPEQILHEMAETFWPNQNREVTKYYNWDFCIETYYVRYPGNYSDMNVIALELLEDGEKDDIELILIDAAENIEIRINANKFKTREELDMFVELCV